MSKLDLIYDLRLTPAELNAETIMPAKLDAEAIIYSDCGVISPQI